MMMCVCARARTQAVLNNAVHNAFWMKVLIKAQMKTPLGVLEWHTIILSLFLQYAVCIVCIVNEIPRLHPSFAKCAA